MTLYKEIGIPNVFTLEASFLGSDIGEFAGVHFTTAHLRQIGRDICKALIPYFGLTLPLSMPTFNVKEPILKSVKKLYSPFIIEHNVAKKILTCVIECSKS